MPCDFQAGVFHVVFFTNNATGNTPFSITQINLMGKLFESAPPKPPSPPSPPKSSSRRLFLNHCANYVAILAVSGLVSALLF